jgi:UDPglucose 6-dehydrogenase
MRVTVFGLWHLGCVTAACLASAGHEVTGLDLDGDLVLRLRRGEPPLYEPGLSERISEGLASARLRFTAEPPEALRGAEILWVTFDTPVDDQDEADVTWVRHQLDTVVGVLPLRTIVLVSSQVPVGFTASLERCCQGRGIHFACCPENLRLGRALESFERQDRIVVGVRDDTVKPILTELLEPFAARIEWMSIESAEMTKHALNAFLATSVSFINEVARICETVGADAKEVERGLKSEPRIGPRAYLSPGAPFAGGTLARDVRFLIGLGRAGHLATPACSGVVESNDVHGSWIRTKLERLLTGIANPEAAVLGLTYAPGTSTLRRSSAVALCQWLVERGVAVRAHDPAVHELPEALARDVRLCQGTLETLRGADVAIIATAWPEYRELRVDDFAGAMRRATVVDQTWLLAAALATDSRIVYVAPGRPGVS